MTTKFGRGYIIIIIITTIIVVIFTTINYLFPVGIRYIWVSSLLSKITSKSKLLAQWNDTATILL